MERIIILTSEHGIETHWVIKVKNFDDRCGDVIAEAIREHNASYNRSYYDVIGTALTSHGYEFEPVDYMTIDDPADIGGEEEE